MTLDDLSIHYQNIYGLTGNEQTRDRIERLLELTQGDIAWVDADGPDDRGLISFIALDEGIGKEFGLIRFAFPLYVKGLDKTPENAFAADQWNGEEWVSATGRVTLEEILANVECICSETGSVEEFAEGYHAIHNAMQEQLCGGFQKFTTKSIKKEMRVAGGAA